jgi:hypothetical protein
VAALSHAVPSARPATLDRADSVARRVGTSPPSRNATPPHGLWCQGRLAHARKIAQSKE